MGQREAGGLSELEGGKDSAEPEMRTGLMCRRGGGECGQGRSYRTHR